MDKGPVICSLAELVGSRRYARDLIDGARLTYTKPWWDAYMLEVVANPPPFEAIRRDGRHIARS